MTFIEEVLEHGFLHQCTNLDSLKALSDKSKIVAYIGFDITAKSLHVGNLLQIMILRLLQKHGHKPVIVVGGATTKIGDPTGKDEMRKLLTDEDIAANILGIRKSLEKFFTFGDKFSDAVIVNNNDWFANIGYIDFLRDYGKYFSVNRMLTMDSVKLRLEREQNLTFLEFNYMLLQGYDFLELNRRYNCVLQIGGSDQWGNILQGVELSRRVDGKEVFGLTTPLITTSSGAKMGKTAGGAVWINEDMLSPYEYYQFFRNTDDADVLRFAKFYTELSQDELEEFEELMLYDINSSKKKLAFLVTKICHGEEEAQRAEDTARRVFEEGGVEGLPEIEIDLSENLSVSDLLYKIGFAESKTAARKLIRGNGVKVNDELLTDENVVLGLAYFKNHIMKISVGKKKHMVLREKM